MSVEEIATGSQKHDREQRKDDPTSSRITAHLKQTGSSCDFHDGRNRGKAWFIQILREMKVNS